MVAVRRLVIDTATEALSVALFERDALIDHHHEIAGRGHAEKLLPAIAALDGGGRADEIWVDSGPGSFTGVRVGLAAARALAYGWKAELRAYSSLALVATMARPQAPAEEDRLFVALTGGHGELFWRDFDRQTLIATGPTRSTPIDALAGMVEARIFYGSGAHALVAARGWGEAIAILPDARQALALPMEEISADTAPLYGRGADATPGGGAGSAGAAQRP